MKDRIKKLRKDMLHLNQTQFAERIGTAQSTIATYESGRNEPSDPVIQLICKEFNVSKEWLKEGTGEPFVALSREAEITRFIGEIMRDEAPSDQQRILHALIGASPEELHAIAQFARRLAAEYEQEK